MERLHEQVASRESPPQLSSGAPPIAIQVRQDADEYYVARAAFPGGERREVKAASCADVIAALAFIIVMHFDDRRSGNEPGPQPAPAAETLGLPQAPPALTAPWTSFLGASGGLIGGRTPRAMPSAALFYELWRRAGWWEHGARAGLRFGAGRLAPAPDAVSLRSAGAQLDLCPIGISFAALCTGLELAALHVQSGRTLSSEQTLQLSLAGHAGVSLRFVLFGRWLLEPAGGLALPITLEQFVVQRRDGSLEQLHAVGISAYGSLAIGYRL